MKHTHLTLGTLREGNVMRLPLLKNSNGKPSHRVPDGSDWSPADWLEAIVSELGGYASLRMKFRRGDITGAEFKVEAAKKLADVVTYIDVLAFRLGVDLGEAIIDNFNEVSKQVGCNVMIDEAGAYRSRSIDGGRQAKLIESPRVICDGDHGGAPCGDKNCWQRDAPIENGDVA